MEPWNLNCHVMQLQQKRIVLQFQLTKIELTELHTDKRLLLKQIGKTASKGAEIKMSG